ncbi:hypothetical protein BHE74_00020870 [Ensete ventricosum]|nr:hypothetical protein BHE74_00020870 [Ensete ventricosum]
MVSIKVCNFDIYRSVRAVHTGPLGCRYTNRPLPGARRCRPRVAGALSPARGERLRRPVYTVYRPVPVPYRYQDELGIGMANPLRERHHKDKQARKNTYAQRLGWLSSSYSLTLATKFDDAQGKRRA